MCVLPGVVLFLAAVELMRVMAEVLLTADEQQTSAVGGG